MAFETVALTALASVIGGEDNRPLGTPEFCARARAEGEDVARTVLEVTDPAKISRIRDRFVDGLDVRCPPIQTPGARN